MVGSEMPEGLSLPDQMAFTALRNIYDAYHKKLITKDIASAEKRRLRRAYTVAKEAAEFQSKLADHRARQLRDTEAARTACRKNPTTENALLLCNVLDGLEMPYETALYGSDPGQV